LLTGNSGMALGTDGLYATSIKMRSATYAESIKTNKSWSANQEEWLLHKLNVGYTFQYNGDPIKIGYKPPADKGFVYNISNDMEYDVIINGSECKFTKRRYEYMTHTFPFLKPYSITIYTGITNVNVADIKKPKLINSNNKIANTVYRNIVGDLVGWKKESLRKNIIAVINGLDYVNDVYERTYGYKLFHPIDPTKFIYEPFESESLINPWVGDGTVAYTQIFADTVTGGYYQKYLKYKNKYLQYKQFGWLN
jgi:hypothetical protein